MRLGLALNAVEAVVVVEAVAVEVVAVVEGGVSDERHSDIMNS